MKKYIIISMAAVALASCSQKDEITKEDRISNEYKEKIGVPIDPMHFWKTAVKLNVNVNSEERTRIAALSLGQLETILYDVTETEDGNVVSLTVPQGMGNNMELMGVTGEQKVNQKFVLDGSLEQSVDIKFKKTATKENTRAAVTPALYGFSKQRNGYYLDVTLDNWDNVMQFVSLEGVDQSTRGEIVNYELVSKGKFEITFLGGIASSMAPHMLGYYYHSPNTYSDIKFVDIAETHQYDYLDGKAKVQYQLQDNCQAFNADLLPNTWYDCNYDMNDDPVDGSKIPHLYRRDDDAYNSVYIWRSFRDKVSKVRGMTFPIDVPAGMHMGFYVKLDNDKGTNQYAKIIKLGIPADNLPEKVVGYNFSAQAFNYSSTGKKTHRSWIHEFDNFYFMGLEDLYDGGDLDCNDVVFGVTASDIDMVMPDIINPDIDYMIQSDRVLPWTLAFEDVYRGADYDFNDAVIRIVPDRVNETCSVEVMACGTEARMDLHYDGPSGDVFLGEMHELLLGRKDYLQPINTMTGTMSVPRKSIANVSWPRYYSTYDDVRRFYIEVKRGDCNECSDVITLPDEPGKMPEAILVAGDWKWPREGVKITETYSKFESWIQNVADMSIWNWYALPKANTYVNY